MTERLEEIHEQMSKTETEIRESHRKQVFSKGHVWHCHYSQTKPILFQIKYSSALYFAGTSQSCFFSPPLIFAWAALVVIRPSTDLTKLRQSDWVLWQGPCHAGLCCHSPALLSLLVALLLILKVRQELEGGQCHSRVPAMLQLGVIS